MSNCSFYLMCSPTSDSADISVRLRTINTTMDSDRIFSQWIPKKLTYIPSPTDRNHWPIQRNQIDMIRTRLIDELVPCLTAVIEQDRRRVWRRGSESQ